MRSGRSPPRAWTPRSSGSCRSGSPTTGSRSRCPRNGATRKLLAADLRCLDAHAHLGGFEIQHGWPGSLDRAVRHCEAGVAIAELTLGPDFRGLLPWGLIDNRPYLRCLAGLGIARWRLGTLDRAAKTFRRMLWLNPGDNQGARFNLAAVEEGISWEEAVRRDEQRGW